MKNLEIFRNQKKCYLVDSVELLGIEAGFNLLLHPAEETRGDARPLFRFDWGEKIGVSEVLNKIEISLDLRD